MSPSTGAEPRLFKVRSKGQGTFTAELRCGRIGVPVPDVQKQIVDLAEVVGCREVAVTPRPIPGIADITFHWQDPIGRTLPLVELPAAPRGQLAYGIRQDGSVASIKATHSVFIGGQTGSGKSTVMWALLADAVRRNIPLRLYVADPKGGVELGVLGDVVGQTGGRIEVRQYAVELDDIRKMVKSFHGAMKARQKWCATQDPPVRQVEPSWDNPLSVLIFDESIDLADLMKDANSPLGNIVSAGRAFGYTLWACSQVGHADTIGRVRELIPQRICLKVPRAAVTDTVLGAGSASAGAHCHDNKLLPGQGFSYAEEHPAPRKFRAAMVTDAETRMIANGKVPSRMLEVERERGGETGLYQWSDADTGKLLYVGISNDVGRRFMEHYQDERGFTQVNANVKVDWFPTRQGALAEEKALIQKHQPPGNTQHNPSARRRPDLRRKRPTEPKPLQIIEA